jgi:hypothetical protein
LWGLFASILFERRSAAEAERRRLVALYATGELAKAAYVDICTALDRELDVLRRHKAALNATRDLNRRTEIDVRIRQYCERVRARFERCTDFDTRRQFLIDHVERVIYHSRAIVLAGSIPRSGDVQPTAEAIRFRLEGKMRRIKTLLGPKSVTLLCAP